MIRYTEDKWGCLVFPIDTRIEELKLNNCFVAKSNDSIWVFPFKNLNKYIVEYKGFNVFLQQKENFFVLENQVSKRDYHFACKNKLNYVTGKCCEGWSCSGFEVENKFDFQWHKAVCEFIAPTYCDLTKKARHRIHFEDLCPTLEIEQANKKTLSARGKRAGLSRKIKSSDKCNGCVYDNNACVNRWKNAEKNCHVSRKMMNRRLKQIAGKRFGSFDNLVSLYGYVGLENSEYEIILPINKRHFCVADKMKAYGQTKCYRVEPFSEIKRHFKPSKRTPALEYKSKIYMLFLSVANTCRTILSETKFNNAWVYYLACFNVGRTTQSITHYTFKSYTDVLKKFGTEKKEKIFR